MDKDTQNLAFPSEEANHNSNYQEKYPRFLKENGVEAQIVCLILPIVEDLGYQLVRVKLLQQNGLTLQIMAEKFDGTMFVEDCEKLSHVLSPLLDAEDIITQKYHLEISSPGIDRPMVRISDFKNWLTHLIKIELNTLIDGKKRYRGILVAADDQGFQLKIAKTDTNPEKELRINYDMLLTARLVLTDDLIRKTLADDKKAAKN